jgi:dipeptidyl aminopeptidase/acylaminoacyl peptidase
MHRMFRVITLFGLLAAACVTHAKVPVEDFFRDPEFTSVSLSPTGEYITVSVPQGDRTLLAAFKVADMSLVGKWDYGSKRHIDRVRWVNDERFFMYVSRKVGKFDFRVGTPDVYASNVDGSRRSDIPNGGTYGIVDRLDKDPNNILVERSVENAFLSRMNVYSGEVRTVATAPVDFGSFLVGRDMVPRYVFGVNEDLSWRTMRRDGERWTEVLSGKQGEPRLVPLGFSSDEKHVYMSVGEKGGTAGIYAIDPTTDERELLSTNRNVVDDTLLWSGDGHHLLGVEYIDGLPTVDFIDPGHEEARTIAGLMKAFPEHKVSLGGTSRDGRRLLVRSYSDIDPGAYYLFDRDTGKAKFLLASRDWIKPEQMSPMKPFSFTARDGTTVHGYITIPRNSSGKNLPMIMHPHGGPHGPRDVWGFNPEVQFLADRGYAVLQVNFRGSGGYGEDFERKGYRNWGTSMIDDMTDAVQWAVREGIADPDRMCTYGASYGGYAALQSIVREPERYRCTIGYVGVYSLPVMTTDGDIPRSESGRNYLRRVLPEALAEQQAQSAAFNADKIRVPVMLVHGERDERVPMSQFRALRSALVDAGRPPEVEILEPKEGHGFQELENNVRLYNAMEAFLDKHIGAGSVQR